MKEDRTQTKLQDLPAMGSHDIKITDYTSKRKKIWTKY